MSKQVGSYANRTNVRVTGSYSRPYDRQITNGSYAGGASTSGEGKSRAPPQNKTNTINTLARRVRRGPPGKCLLCSYRQVDKPPTAVYHYHFSPQHIRSLAGAENNNEKSFFCPTCAGSSENHVGKTTPGKLHSMKDVKRLKICMSASTMNEFWMDDKYEGDKIHIDWCTSPGADLSTLEHMWRVDYADVTVPMDVLIIGGLNDIIKNRTREQFMESVESFYKAVAAKEGSTFVMATMFYPPQTCWLPDDGKPPTSNYVNKYEMMVKLNDDIIAFNNRVFKEQEAIYKAENYGWMAGCKSRAPKFHTYGMQKKTKKTRSGRKVEIRKHRFQWFRETRKEKMLHLKDAHRRSMGQAVNHYFQEMFKPVINE